MREMHKWKDKVELSLDNRQIFFLFFGLSVVGCFVFALGVMVGHRVDWSGSSQVAQVEDDPLQALDGLEDEAGPELTFQQGLTTPATALVPPTRDPSEVQENSNAEAAQASEAQAKPTQAQASDAAASTLAASAPATPPKPAAARGKKISVDPSRKRRLFTLQMKAFSREDEAQRFAERLRSNGHDVRVEAHEVRGRLWYRVRMGTFKSWDAALAAKAEFERAEHLIAYVVRD